MYEPCEDVAVLAEKYGGLYLDEDELFQLRECLAEAMKDARLGNAFDALAHLEQIERMVGL